MSARLNPLAVHNADVLRLIEDMARSAAVTSVAELARQAGRDKSNLAKTLKALAAEGLLTDVPLKDGLTAEGRAQLAMIGRAEDPARAEAASARGASDSAPSYWPLDMIRPNPANRPVDPATIPGLADSIEAAGEVLQPALLTPPDASGVRMLLAGERRWSALCLLKQRGTADEDLWGRGLPFIEKEADPSTALLITLIENGQREDLSPWEEARQLKALKDETGWSAREIAKKTGRSPEGSETGVRDVQIKIKVADEATDEARAQYDRDVAEGRPDAWQRLKDSIRPAKPPAPVNPRMALMIAEAAAASERLHGVWDGPVPLAPGIGWIASDNEWWTYGADGAFTLKARSTDWLASIDFGENEERAFLNLRSDAGAPHVLPGISQAEPEAAPPLEPRTSSGGSLGRNPEPGSEAAARALAELAKWEREAPDDQRRDTFVRIERTAAWADSSFRRLRETGLIKILHPGDDLFAALRPSGREWLATKGTGYVATVTGAVIWKTPWIARIAAPTDAEPAPTPAPAPASNLPERSPGADRTPGTRKAAAEALRFLHQRWTNFEMFEGEKGRGEFNAAAEQVDTPLPWRIDAWGGVVAANGNMVIGGRRDPDPDSPSRTRMRMIVLAVNAMGGELTPADEAEPAPAEGEGGE